MRAGGDLLAFVKFSQTNSSWHLVNCCQNGSGMEFGYGERDNVVITKKKTIKKNIILEDIWEERNSLGSASFSSISSN